MKNITFLFLLMLLIACIWFAVTWTYISLDIYDMSQIPAGEYKVLEMREKFIELALIVGIFFFGLCIGAQYSYDKNNRYKKQDLHGFVPMVGDMDNLQLIEGIGPKIEEVLHNAGVTTFHGLANASNKDLRRILEKAGDKFTSTNYKTWSEQAEMADLGRWRHLKNYQDEILGGL